MSRPLNLLTSLLLLLLLSPLLLFIALCIKCTMPGPVLFRQTRIGKGGAPFKIIKFRTMTVAHHGSTITLAGESRITPLGSRLRKSKLDELPELWNILKGEMSFVGPRPDVPGYADKLTGDDRIILSVRPGLTGAASLLYNDEDTLLARQPDPRRYNDEILYPHKVKIDKNYIRHKSLTLDLKIILYTLLKKRLSEPWAA